MLEREEKTVPFADLPPAYARHQIITDDNDKAVDLLFVEVNAAFEQMSGVPREDTVGEKASAILHRFRDLGFDWTGVYDRMVCAAGNSCGAEQHVEALDRWYEIDTFPGDPGCIILIIRDITSKKNNEHKASEKDTWYVDFMDTARDLIQCVDSEGRFVYINQAWLSTLGYTAEEVAGMTLDDVIHPDSKEHCKAVFERVLQGKVAGEVEAVFVTRDGNPVMAEGNVSVKLDENGRFAHTRGIFRNVTAFKAAEAELKLAEETYRNIFYNAQVGLFRTDIKTGLLLDANDAVARFCGFPDRAALMAEPFSIAERYVNPEDRAAMISRLQTEGRFENYEAWFRRNDGSDILVRFSGRLVPEKGWIEGVSEDITDRKRAEEALRESEQKHRRLFETMTQGVIYQAADGKIISANPAAERVLGLSFEQMQGKTSMDPRWQMIKEDGTGVPGTEHPAMVALRTGQTVGPVTRGVFHQGKNGHVWLSITAIPLFHPGEKEPFQAYATFEDITRRRQAEEKIRYLSYHDQLTGLYNRYYLEEEMKRLDTDRQLPVSVIMADLNGLKLLNDTCGHQNGDEMLQMAADILRSVCRKDDLLARFGGDEFVLYLPQTPYREAHKICARIEEACRNERVSNVPLSLSTGLAVKVNAEQKLTDLLREAEDKMYRDKLTESRSGKSAIVNSLLRALAEKSYETEAHTRNMQETAKSMGEKLGLPRSELHRLQLLITLHDIGKINISEELLTRKEPLDDGEWEIIKKHCEIGYRIAKATDDFVHVAEDILAHHERWDGSGYPQGLQGEAIPFLARITAIADAFEVMSNGRPYKGAMALDEIVEELKSCSGTQFDPQLVDTFLSILQADGSEG